MKSFAAWLFIALTIASSPCEAGLVYVTLGNSGTLATASLTNTFTTTTNACPAGSLIILWANYESTSDAPSSVTDSAGNTYQTPIDNIAGSGIGIGIVYAKNTSANLPVGGTITATFAGSVTSRVGASCVTGASQTAPLDTHNNSANGTAATSATSVNTGTLENTNEIVFGVFAASANLGSEACNGSYSNKVAGTAVPAINVCEQIVTSKSSLAFSPSWGNSVNYVSDILSFQAPFPSLMFTPAIVP